MARRFADRKLYDKAVHLFRIALELDPRNMGIRLNLAQVLERQRKEQGAQERDAAQRLRERYRRNAIDAAQFFGLAALYDERGKPKQAAECLEIARRKDIVNPYVHKLHGKLLLRSQRYSEAAEALREARRYNPFDRETSELLSRVEYENEHFRDAIETAIDAFWLLKEDDRDGTERLKKRIRMLKTVQRMGNQELVELFHEQKEKLQTAFDRLEWQRERLRRETGEPEDTSEPITQLTHGSRRRRIQLAARLSNIELWQNLDDEQIFQLSGVVYEEDVAHGESLFRFKDPGRDFYLLDRGSILIRRTTHYGTYDLGRLETDAFFGEVSFITGQPRSADATAQGDCRLLRFDGNELRRLISEEPSLGLEIYVSLWHGVAQKLRHANEQLLEFFSSDTDRERLEAEKNVADRVQVDSATKIKLFQDQGLTAAELETLANFSDVKRFAAGSTLFHEGDEGDEMYVVLEGKVRISKFIPGGGEEALAILERGDFFGEMSMIDRQPRSADATAHGGSLTAVTLNRATLDEVMSMDPAAALQFMELLCRLVCKRLAEIDDKLTSWRIMVGARSDEDTVDWSQGPPPIISDRSA